MISQLKTLIKNSELRVVSYKNILEDIGKNKIRFDPLNPETIWYKSLVRENKNSEQVWLKKLVDERISENEGLNAPFYYPSYWKNK